MAFQLSAECIKLPAEFTRDLNDLLHYGFWERASEDYIKQRLHTCCPIACRSQQQRPYGILQVKQENEIVGCQSNNTFNYHWSLVIVYVVGVALRLCLFDIKIYSVQSVKVRYLRVET